jgi:hypothetical protein
VARTDQCVSQTPALEAQITHDQKQQLCPSLARYSGVTAGHPNAALHMVSIETQLHMLELLVVPLELT